MSTAPTTSPGIDDIVVRHVTGGVVVESRLRPWAFITAFAVFCVCWDVGAIAFVATTSPALMWFTVGVPAVVLTAMLVDPRRQPHEHPFRKRRSAS